ncbi:hypothetical protein A4X03_0g5629 [Tilletia caries]|uniref:Roadblock/LAMTOR2 domain-containing protein n=1 Tax=Tilletia caries TaxID=13290 RepID=A0A8T8T3G4_9BASI|nr:hypothetical protein A4X03_0g5629 [Tilletia caries]
MTQERFSGFFSRTRAPGLSILTTPVSPNDHERNLHVVISPVDIQRKPHDLLTAPPPPGSPMPPSAGLLPDEDGSEYASVDETRSTFSSDDDDDDDDDGNAGVADGASFDRSDPTDAANTTCDTDATALAPTICTNPFDSIVPEALSWDSEPSLSKITNAHRSVIGTLVLTRTDCAIVRATGPTFDPSGPGSHERGARLIRLVKMVKRTMAVVDEEVQHVDEEDEMDLLRVRSKLFEAVIIPGPKFILVVFQDPTLQS